MSNDVTKLDGKSTDATLRESPTLSIEKDKHGGLSVDFDGDWSRISTPNKGKEIAKGLIGQIASLGSHGKIIDEGAANFAVGFIDAMEPRDAAEALLLSQMVAIHQATMMLARRLNHVENIPQQDAAERALNKLARSYAAQMDTLKRYRSKGKQTVRVERVTVESGGQAVVGNVTRGGGTQ